MVQFVCCMWGEGEQRAPNERNYAERALSFTSQPNKDTYLAFQQPVRSKRKLGVGLLNVPDRIPQAAG